MVTQLGILMEVKYEMTPAVLVTPRGLAQKE